VFASSSDWLVGQLVFVVIGWGNYVIMVLRHSFEKRSNKHKLPNEPIRTWIKCLLPATSAGKRVRQRKIGFRFYFSLPEKVAIQHEFFLNISQNKEKQKKSKTKEKATQTALERF